MSNAPNSSANIADTVTTSQAEPDSTDPETLPGAEGDDRHVAGSGRVLDQSAADANAAGSR